MKKLLFIILLFIPASVFGQTSMLQLITHDITVNVQGYVTNDDVPNNVEVIQAQENLNRYHIFSAVNTFVNMHSDTHFVSSFRAIDEPNTYACLITIDDYDYIYLILYNEKSNRLIIIERNKQRS